MPLLLGAEEKWNAGSKEWQMAALTTCAMRFLCAPLDLMRSTPQEYLILCYQPTGVPPLDPPTARIFNPRNVSKRGSRFGGHKGNTWRDIKMSLYCKQLYTYTCRNSVVYTLVWIFFSAVTGLLFHFDIRGNKETEKRPGILFPLWSRSTYIHGV